MNITAALELVLQLMASAQQVGQAIARARSEGRDEISDEDLDAVVGSDTAARARLVSAIEVAKAQGR